MHHQHEIAFAYDPIVCTFRDHCFCLPVLRTLFFTSGMPQVLITNHQNSGALQTLAPLSSGDPVGENLSREIYGGLKTNARWLPEST